MKRQLERCPADDPDTLVNSGCVLYKEGKYDAAAAKFGDVLGMGGYQVRRARL